MKIQYLLGFFKKNIVILFTVFTVLFLNLNLANAKETQKFTTEEDYKYLAPGQITKVRSGSVDSIHRLVFEVTKEFEANIEMLSFPFRIVFNIPAPYEWKVSEEDLAEIVSNDYIEGFRYGVFDANTFRVVIDLNRAMVLQRSFLLKNNGEKEGYRFVIDLRESISSNSTTKSVSRVSVIDEKYKNITSQHDTSLSLDSFNMFEEKLRKAQHIFFDTISYPAPKIPDRPVIVTLDPGHGGKDPGATVEDLQEKDLVLDMSKRIGSILMRHPEVGVVLTRNDDFYVPLRDRVLISRYVNSNLFVSIHADKAVTQEASGLSVYTLSEIASDASSYYIASNENKSDTIAGVSASEDDEQVIKILNSLSQRYNLNESINLAGEILNSAQQDIKLLENPKRSAAFVVLKTNEIPSVLVELGFLSNQNDVEFYKTVVNRNSAALSIAKGILYYLSRTGQLKEDYVPIIEEIETAVKKAEVNYKLQLEKEAEALKRKKEEESNENFEESSVLEQVTDDVEI